MNKRPDHKLRHQYACQKSKAKQRGIDFHLTYEEWFDVWKNSGHFEQRGCKKGCYVMSRIKDQGPYAIGNIIIQPKYMNDTEPQVIQKISNTKKGSIPWNKKVI